MEHSLTRREFDELLEEYETFLTYAKPTSTITFLFDDIRIRVVPDKKDDRDDRLYKLFVEE